MEMNRNDVISLVIRMTLLSTCAYYGTKWLIGQIDPTNQQKKRSKETAICKLRSLGLHKMKNLTDHELMIASHLVNPYDITVSWNNIAGLSQVIDEIKETVIFPVQRKELLRNSVLTKPPKGVLLHGPPGCGKTMIAKATAREAGMNFLYLDVSLLTDKWYGESQKLAGAVFSLAQKLQPCIIFIDEIDSFLRSRTQHDHEATAMMKAQFMMLWDGLSTDPENTVIVMGATNRPKDLDPAILRRMPATFEISLPDEQQRKEILTLVLNTEQCADNVDLHQLAITTSGFSGSDLQELCRIASLFRIKDLIKEEEKNQKCSLNSNSINEGNINMLRPISMDDLLASVNKMKASKVVSTTQLRF